MNLLLIANILIWISIVFGCSNFSVNENRNTAIKPRTIYLKFIQTVRSLSSSFLTGFYKYDYVLASPRSGTFVNGSNPFEVFHSSRNNLNTISKVQSTLLID